MSVKLRPCPFCGNGEPEFERLGDRRQSCIVACGHCGARHESSDEGESNGQSWNRRPREDALLAHLAKLRDLIARIANIRDDMARGLDRLAALARPEEADR